MVHTGYTPDVSIQVRVHNLPVRTLSAFLEASVAHPGRHLDAVSKFAGFSSSTGRKALPTLESLDLVARNADGAYYAKAEGIRRGGDPEVARLAIRRALQTYRPFEAICEGLALGETPRDAKRKAALLLELDMSSEAKLDVLIQLGKEVGILEGEGERVVLIADLAPGQVKEVQLVNGADVDSEAKARLLNGKWLGRTVNNMLDEVDRQLLCDALLSYSSDPRRSVGSSAQAVEDFLREIAQNQGLAAEARKANGAGQLALLLVSRGVIHANHQKLVEAVSTPRNATDHRKDKRTLKPWEISELGAFAVFAQALTAIRSIGEFVTARRQTI
jgi:hypothetical protein